MMISMISFAEGIKGRLFRRVAIFVALSLTLVTVFVLLRLHPIPNMPHLDHIGQTIGDFVKGDLLSPSGPGMRICSDDELEEPAIAWEAIRAKYDGLLNDKFTIALQTYKRPTELADTLKTLTEYKIASLHEIVVVWNDLEEKPPKNWTSEHGVSVRYRASTRNSLNEKLIPDPAYATQAIFLSDDDVYYYPSDLEFAFQAWRNFGRYRLTGALARCASTMGSDDRRHWKYDFCPRPKDAFEDHYSMIITNLAFAHISFLDYYSSDDPLMTSIRAYVDQHFNCEDIAMNYVMSLITRTGPLLVRGLKQYHSDEPKIGISRKPGHLRARSQCLDDFSDMVGCMPLVNETTKIVRGIHT